MTKLDQWNSIRMHFFLKSFMHACLLQSRQQKPCFFFFCSCLLPSQLAPSPMGTRQLVEPITTEYRLEQMDSATANGSPEIIQLVSQAFQVQQLCLIPGAGRAGAWHTDRWSRFSRSRRAFLTASPLPAEPTGHPTAIFKFQSMICELTGMGDHRLAPPRCMSGCRGSVRGGDRWQ